MKCKECGAENPANSEFCQECGTKLAAESADKTQKKGWWKRQTLTGKILIIFFALILIGIVAVVAIVMSAPEVTALNITSANSSMDSKFSTLEINGTTDPGATVAINNTQVTADSNGKFNYNLTNIANGTTNINITAKAANKQFSSLIMQLVRSVTNTGGGTDYELRWHWNGTVSHYS